MRKNISLTEGKIISVLLKFTFPILLSMLLQITYGTVDLLVVGQFSSIGDVSGVTIGSQVIQTITAFFTGLSMGTTVLLGRYIGSKEHDKTTKTVGVSVAIFGVIAILTTISLLFMNELIATWMQTPSESFEQTSSYLFFSGIGCIFIVFYNLIGSIFRGIGDSKTPLVTVFIACIVNIVLDLILVAVFNLGATGAAIATTVAQGVSVILSLMMLKKRVLPFDFSVKTVRFDFDYAKRIILLGLPIAMQSALVSVSFLVMTSIINVFGVVASAAVGIVSKITGIIMLVPSSFMQSLSAFTAQNYGAKQYKRADKGLKYGMLISLGIGVVMAYVAGFHGEIFTRLFTDDPDTTIAALQYLQSYAVDTVLVAVLFSMTGYFNGCGKTTFVMVQSVAGAFLIRIPLAYLFSSMGVTSLFIIGLSTPASTLVQIIACYFFYVKYKKSMAMSLTT